MIVSGILSAGAICKKLCLLQNINFYDFIIISAVAGGLGFVFAKLFYIATAFPLSKFFYVLWLMLRHPVKANLISGGFVFYGGLLGGIAGYFAGVKIARCKSTDFLNTFAFAIPYVHAFGRIGCFCAGCCYGIPYDGPLALHYSHPISDVVCGPGIFPVQLVEALLLFTFSFWVLVVIWRALRQAQGPHYAKYLGKLSPSLFIIYILYYSLIRFFLEFLRGDKERGLISLGSKSFLSTSQAISLILFTAATILAIILLIKSRKNDKVKERKIQNA